MQSWSCSDRAGRTEICVNFPKDLIIVCYHSMFATCNPMRVENLVTRKSRTEVAGRANNHSIAPTYQTLPVDQHYRNKKGSPIKCIFSPSSPSPTGMFPLALPSSSGSGADCLLSLSHLGRHISRYAQPYRSLSSSQRWLARGVSSTGIWGPGSESVG